MTSIATRTGDDGTTGLFGGARVRKDDPRVLAYGDVDELNSTIGLARAEPLDPAVAAPLERVQNDLFALGADLATPRAGNPHASKVNAFDDRPLGGLDADLARLEAAVKPLTAFVLPGGSRAAATLHVARAVCRRAERSVVALATAGSPHPPGIRYLNRLSDLLFIMARLQNARDRHPETEWRA